LEVFYFIIIIIMGLVISSFLNVCIDRLPRRQSLIRPPSHCDVCSRRLSPGDLVPVFSYLFLKGKCRYCGARIPPRVLIVELITPVIFGLLFWKAGLSINFAIMVFYVCIFLVIFFIDLEHQLILNIMVYPMMFVAFLISSLSPEPSWHNALYSLVGGATAFTIFLIIAWISKGGMGFGDVKMAGMIGLATGMPGVFAALMVAILFGGLVALFLLIFRIKKKKEGIPFGPFLAIGAMTALIWGQEIINWYITILNGY